MRKIDRVLFIGSKHLGLRVLKEIYSLSKNTLIGVLTFDDSSDTRSVLTDFKHFSNYNDIVCNVAKDREEAEKIILYLKPDFCLVVGWYWLISSKVLGYVSSGFVGIHNSLLPKYRGGSPLIWPIINNENEVGFSFFSFTQGMDEGGILAQGRVCVHDNDYISDVLSNLEDEIIKVLKEKYIPILDGEVTPTGQDHGLATYCSQRFPHDGNIDWKKTAQDVYNFIRAQSDPYPGAFTYFNCQQIKIWRGRVFESPYYGTPGQVSRISSDGVYVICGDHRAIIIEEVEVGGKRGNANKFIKSITGRMCSIIT